MSEARSSRHALIAGWRQEKIRAAEVIIGGIGALGNEVAKNLAQAGVGKMVLVDMDKIESTNLNRTVLFTPDDVGEAKAEVGAKAIERLTGDVKVEPFVGTFQDFYERHLDDFRSVDLVLSCFDNMEARFYVNNACAYETIPLVDGGMLGLAGSIQVSCPPLTPCLECNVSDTAYANVGRRFSCTTNEVVDLTLQQREVVVPSVATTTSIVGAIQAQEALKIIMGLDEFLRNGLWHKEIGKPIETRVEFDGRWGRLMVSKLERNPNCYVCGVSNPLAAATDRLKLIKLRISRAANLSELKRLISEKLETWSGRLCSGFQTLPSAEEIDRNASVLCAKLNFLARGLMQGKEAGHVSQVTIDPVMFRLYSDLKSCSQALAKRSDASEPLTSRVASSEAALVKTKSIQPGGSVSPEISLGLNAGASEALAVLEELRRMLADDVPISQVVRSDQRDIVASACSGLLRDSAVVELTSA